MPVLNDATMDQQTLPTGHYGYSATRLENLGAAEYTVVTIVTDVSGSVSGFIREREDALEEIVNACRLSPRADNLLLRLVAFSNRLEKLHGFKLLEQCHLSDYRGILRVGGNTALYDSAENAIAATASYARQLAGANFAVNAILFVITDGMDNASTMGVGHVREALSRAVTSEACQSLISVLIGVNVQDRSVGGYLRDFKSAAGFTQYIEIGQANAKLLARLTDFVSRSISAQSQALGTGGPSRSLTF
jgi:hypothetical protein